MSATTTTSTVSVQQKVSRNGHPDAAPAGTKNVGNSTKHERAAAPTPINPIWRVKVTQWCYDYIDCISERRSVVYIAMNILDRYCRASATTVDHSHFQVAALAATYLAIRIAGGSSSSYKEQQQQPEKTMTVQLSDLVVMSRGKTSQTAIIAMGTTIVKALSWEERMETPTEWVFRYVDQTCHDATAGRAVVETANFMVEVATFDTNLCEVSPRILAAAAVLRVLPSQYVPALVAMLRADAMDPKVVHHASQVLGVFVKESLRKSSTSSSSLAAIPRPDDQAAQVPHVVPPHVIEDDEEDSFSTFKIERQQDQANDHSPVYINGFVLVPNEDDDDDAMDES